MHCIQCGCTETEPCVAPDGSTCSWLTVNGEIPRPPICSACVRESAGAGVDLAPALDEEDDLPW